MSTASGGYYPAWNSHIPSRGLIGYRGEFLTDTKGNGILNTTFDGYAPYKGDIQYRKQGSLIAFEAGEVCYLRSVHRTGAWYTVSSDLAKRYTAGMVIGQNAQRLRISN